MLNFRFVPEFVMFETVDFTQASPFSDAMSVARLQPLWCTAPRCPEVECGTVLLGTAAPPAARGSCCRRVALREASFPLWSSTLLSGGKV
jgi:hypothetical protein